MPVLVAWIVDLVRHPGAFMLPDLCDELRLEV